MSDKIQLTDFDWKAAAIAAMQSFSALAFSSNQNELLLIFLGEGRTRAQAQRTEAENKKQWKVVERLNGLIGHINNPSVNSSACEEDPPGLLGCWRL